MCNSSSRWSRATLRAAMGHFGWTTAAAAGLWSATAALAEEPPRTAVLEGSVLVATREAEPGQVTPFARPQTDSTDSGALEPISQYPEHTPDLADGNAPPAVSAQIVPSEMTPIESSIGAEPRQFEGSSDLGVAYTQGVDAEPALFNGIQPGTSTENDVIAAWDDPSRENSTNEGSVLTYDIDPFKQVDVLISDERVSAIKIELEG